MSSSYSNLLKLASILVTFVSVWSVGRLLANPLNQVGGQQKNQIMHPEAYYQAAQSGGYMDSNKIRGYSGDDEANLVEGNTNSKRTRKISTFMPMRGKKDATNGASTTLDNLMTAYSIVPLIRMRLLESAMARQEQQQLGERQAMFGNLDQETEQQRGVGEPANMNRYLDMDEASQSGNVQSSQLIQNKLRRAFHPMRGKKSIMEEYMPVEASLSDPLPLISY